MADRALLFGVMVDLAPMAGQAERARGLQRRNRALSMALIARPVRVGRGCMGLNDGFSPVTRRAVDPRGVVVLVAGGALRHRQLGLEAHARGVALHAAEVRVLVVLKPNCSGARRLSRNGHRDGHMGRLGQFG